MIYNFTVTCRDRSIPVLLDLEAGRYFSDDAMLHYLRNCAVPEPELTQVLFRGLRPGDLAVDAGANIGFFTILMSKLVGAAGSVIAIEPDTRNIAMLRKNLDINECRNVEVIMDPLSCGPGNRVAFVREKENGQSYVGHEVGDCGDLLRTTSLDVLLDDRACRLLKMDIEGSEYEALLGLEDYTDRIPIIVSEVNPDALKRAESSPEELIQWLYERGYIPHELRASGGMPARIYPRYKQRVKIARQNTNMLFCDSKTLVTQLWPEVEL